MTTSCHLTKAPEMKYIDERYQSQPTLPSYPFGGISGGGGGGADRGGISFHMVIRSSVLITKLALLPPALSLPPLQSPLERKSVMQCMVYSCSTNYFKVNYVMYLTVTRTLYYTAVQNR